MPALTPEQKMFIEAQEQAGFIFELFFNEGIDNPNKVTQEIEEALIRFYKKGVKDA